MLWERMQGLAAARMRFPGYADMLLLEVPTVGVEPPSYCLAAEIAPA